MENLPTKDQAYTYLKGWASKAKQYAYNLTPTELKAEEATNNEAWGPTGTVMSELCCTELTNDSFDPTKYKEIMGVLAKRLQDEGENWRHVYKSLLLLEYMTKHGPQKVVDELNGNPAVLRKLKDFEYKDANGKDWGLNVRHRAKELAALVSDSDKLRMERAKAKENSQKYVGVSSDDARSGGRQKQGGFSSTGFGSTGFGSGSGSSSKLDSDFSSKLKFGGDAREAPDANDAVAETQKRIAALREQPAGDSSPPRTAQPSSARAAPEGPKGPKKLSEVRVDPSIAAQFGRLPMPAPAAQQPPAQPRGQSADQGGHLLAPRQAGTGAAAAPAAQPDLWDMGDSEALSSDSRGFSTSDPFGGAFDSLSGPSTAGAAPAPAHAQPPSGDPFAALSAPAPQAPSDPFEDMSRSASQPGASHTASGAFSKPADPPNRDPFASISKDVPGPASNTAMARSPHGRSDSFGSLTGGKPASPSMQAAPSSPLKQGSSAATPQGRSSQALPEDLFGAGPSPSPAGPHAPQYGGQPSRFGLPGQQPQQQQQQWGMQQQQQQQGQWQGYQQQAQRAQGQGSSPTAFGSFAGAQGAAPGGMQGGFSGPFQAGRPGSQPSGGGAGSGSWQGSGASSQSTGLPGLDSHAPGAQHFAAPPMPAKKDPFAGLTGF